MLQPLLLAIPGAYLFFIAAVMLQLRVQIARSEKNTQWMAERSGL
jgi:hypothetical protein